MLRSILLQHQTVSEIRPLSPRLGKSDYVLLSLVCLMPILFYAVIPVLTAGGGHENLTLLYILTHSWNYSTNYEHGYFIIPAMLAIIYKNWGDIKATAVQKGPMGLLFVIFALVLFVLAVRVKNWRIAAGALPILIYGMIHFTTGRKKASWFIFPLALFYFCIPAPQIVQATNSLQILVTNVAAKMASFTGVPLVRTGNVVNILGTGDFNVDEGCSGIRSLMALLMIAFVYGHFAHKQGWKRVAIFAAAIPMAILANILRIYSILLVANYISADFAKTIYHDKVGFLSFAIALGLLLLMSRILEKGFNIKGPATVIRQSKGPAAAGLG